MPRRGEELCRRPAQGLEHGIRFGDVLLCPLFEVADVLQPRPAWPLLEELYWRLAGDEEVVQLRCASEKHVHCEPVVAFVHVLGLLQVRDHALARRDAL